MLEVTGFNPPRYEDTQKELQETLQNFFGGVADLSEDALMGVYNSIMALSCTSLWELSTVVYDSSNLLSAEGFLLDNLALLVGVVRLPASYTRGVVWFTGNDGAIVESTAKVQSTLGDVFNIEREIEVTSTSCIEVKVKIRTLVQDSSYTIEAGEIGATSTYRREPTPDQTALEILTDISVMLVEDNAEFENVKVLLDASGDPYIFIKKVNTGQNMSISGTTYFDFIDVVTPAIVHADVQGNIPAKAHTITIFLPNQRSLPIHNVDNPYDLQRGRGIETDEELRMRVLNAYMQVAGGTSDAIQRAVASVFGVSSVKVVRNTTDLTSNDSKALPPKSFQVIVYNGDGNLIAETIWKNKPAGIQCYATPNNPLTEKHSIIDFNGQVHEVSFVRPTTQFIYVRVEYNLYSEESFPKSGELILAEELANYGQTLQIGEDVITDRFIPHVYRNVKGIEDCNIYIASVSNVDIVPQFPDDYTSASLSVSDEEITNFTNSRIQVKRYKGDLPDYT
jgi:uncharacterized phage protein gp47/JayE